MECPYKEAHPGLFREPERDAFFRFMNASPKAPTFDVYVNDSLLVPKLFYGNITDYFPAFSGEYNIKVYNSGAKTKPYMDTDINIPTKTITNISFIGTFPNISLYPIPEPDKGQRSGRACIRIVNLAPDSPPIDITSTDGTKIFSAVKYMDYTLYACIPEGTYSFVITAAKTNKVLYRVSNVVFNSNNYYGLYVLGLVNDTPPISVVEVSEPR